MWNPKNFYRRSRRLLALAAGVKQALIGLHGVVVRRERVHRYLARADSPRLNVGAGPNDLPGWLNADLTPKHRHHIYLDATRPLPFAEGTFTHIYAEHMIQHLRFGECVDFLRECRRVMRPGGRIRLASADLAALVDLYASPEKTDVQERYVRWIVDRFVPDAAGAYSAGFVLNNAFYNWRSRFLYDRTTLRLALERAGFCDVRAYAVGESDDPHLRDIEQHGLLVGDELNLLETIVFEAARPGDDPDALEVPR